MGADAVFSLVPDDAVLKQVVCDASSGLLGAFTGVHISCSTIHPEVQTLNKTPNLPPLLLPPSPPYPLISTPSPPCPLLAPVLAPLAPF